MDSGSSISIFLHRNFGSSMLLRQLAWLETLGRHAEKEKPP